MQWIAGRSVHDQQLRGCIHQGRAGQEPATSQMSTYPVASSRGKRPGSLDGWSSTPGFPLNRCSRRYTRHLLEEFDEFRDILKHLIAIEVPAQVFGKPSYRVLDVPVSVADEDARSARRRI